MFSPSLLFLPTQLVPFPPRDAQHARHELRRSRALIVRRDGIHDDSRVDVRIDDAHGRHVRDRALADRVQVGNRVQEDDEVGHDALPRRDVRAEELHAVRQRAREPLLADVVRVLAHALRGEAHGVLEVRAGAHEDDGAVVQRDGAHERRGAPQERERRVEVDQCDARARAVRVWREGGVDEGFGVS